MKKILFTLLTILFFIPKVHAAENESFYSKTLLGKFVNGEWQQVTSITSQTNQMNLSQLGDYYDVYPVWMGFYGNASKGFTTDKIYNLSFRIDYSSSGNRFFQWKKAMQYAKMEIVIDNSVVNYCTMNVNNDTYSEFTCEFKVSQNSGSYYEINVNWWSTNLDNLGFNGIYPEYGMILKFDLALTSNTDYNGQLVSQNEIIIGQNQQIIDSNNATNDKLDDLKDSIISTDGPTNLGALDNSAGWLPAGPVDSILNLPLSLLNSLLTAVSSTCQPLNITFPFVDFNYQLPCISSIYAKISGLNSIIDLIGYTVGVLILYYYLKHLYKWIDNKITMQNDNDWGGI